MGLGKLRWGHRLLTILQSFYATLAHQHSVANLDILIYLEHHSVQGYVALFTTRIRVA
jgi:hypothetical protein